MSGTRLQTRNTPIVRRMPQWSVSNYYPEGILVWYSLDSDTIDTFVCLKSHYTNDSEGSLFIDGVLNSEKWLRESTNRNLDSDLIDAKRKANILKTIVDSDERYIDSEINLLYYIAQNSGANYDSDLAVIDSDTTVLENRIIYKMTDSDVRHNNLVLWDSDNNNFVFRNALLSINQFAANANGVIPISFSKVLRGDLDSRPDSEVEGTFYVVSGDSDSEQNGFTYIYDSVEWLLFKNGSLLANDQKYLKVDGTNYLTGPLYVRSPIRDSEIVNKAYVDFYSSQKKQDAFFFYDSEGAADTSIMDSENIVVFTGGLPKLGFFDETNIQTIQGLEVSVDEEFIIGASTDSENIVLQVANFNSEVPGTVSVSKDGVAIPIEMDSDGNVYIISGTATEKTFVLLNYAVQNFVINTLSNINISSEYVVNYLTHYGSYLYVTKPANDSEWFIEVENMDYGNF